MTGYQTLVKVLQSKQIDISWEEVLTLGGKENNPQQVLKKHIYEAIAHKGYTKNWKEAKKLVQDDPELNIPRPKPDPIVVINEIHRTGGIAILAHPYLISDHVTYKDVIYSREEYINLLIQASLDGIEACYSYDKTSYNGIMTKEAIEKEIKEKYIKKVPVISGGSDYHADYRKDIENPRELGETGITPEYFYENSLLKGIK